MENENDAIGKSDHSIACYDQKEPEQLYFVADSQQRPAERRRHDLAGAPDSPEGEARQRERLRDESRAGIDARGVADPDGRNASTEGLQRSGEHGQQQEDGGAGGLALTESEQHDRSGNERRGRGEPSDRGELGDAKRPGLQEQRGERGTSREAFPATARETTVGTSTSVDDAQATAWVSGRKTMAQPGFERERFATNGFWRDADWLPCVDGKARPVEPGTFPLAHGAPARVGRLRAAGNAICAPQAAEFIRAYGMNEARPLFAEVA